MGIDVTHTTAELTSGRAEKSSQATKQPGASRAVLWVANHELWIVIVAAPALLFPGRFPPLIVVTALLVLILLWPVRWLALGSITRRTPFDIPLWSLVLMLPASLCVSADISASLPKLTGLLLGVALFYAVVNTTTSWEGIAWVVGFLILGAVGVVGVSLIGTNWGGEKLPFISHAYQFLPTYSHGLTRTGFFNRNQVGGTMILFIPLNSVLFLWSLARVRDARRNDKIFSSPSLSSRHRFTVSVALAVSLFLMVGTLLLTQSRSALIGVGVALLLLPASQKRWAGMAFISVVVLSLIGIWWLGPADIGRLLLDVTEAGSSGGTLNFAGRQEVWSRAVYMLQDFPYTGVGLGMFEQVAHILYPFFLIGPDTLLTHAHNVFLQVGVDLGIPGLIAYVGFNTACCLAAWRASRRAPTLGMQAVILGLLGGIVAYHIYGLTDAMTLGAKPGAALWVMYGLVAVVVRHCDT